MNVKGESRSASSQACPSHHGSPARACPVVVAITLVSPLHLVSQLQGRHDSIVTRARWLWLVLCFIAFPFTARADGIDLPILITYGVGIFLPLLLFNATVEAPIMGRFLGIKFSELWPLWFKANVWSLLAGIPALVLNEALTGWFLPAELGRRVRTYPFFLPVHFRLLRCNLSGGASLHPKGSPKGGGAGKSGRDGQGRSSSEFGLVRRSRPGLFRHWVSSNGYSRIHG